MATGTCAQCGKSEYYDGNNNFYGPTGWLTKKNFLGGVVGFYCSKNCKNQDTAQKESSPSKESKGENKVKEQEAKKSASAEIFKVIDEGNRLRDEQENQMKKELEAKVKEIAQIDFGSSKDSISNVLDQLVIIGSSKPTPKERKAIFDKMEIGIMKLKKMGESDCSYYEQKMLKIKPTIWQKIGYYFANN
jgi:hypothetical protein